MALFRTLCRTQAWLATSGGAARRELSLGATGGLQQRARRNSLPGSGTGSGGIVRGVFGDKAVGVTSDRASSTAQAVRSSVQDPEAKAKKLVITYDELTASLAQEGQGGAPGVRLVDVREPKEIEETGRLPGAINIPLTKLKAALALEPAQFEAEFGAPKPTKDDPAPLVFYGLCGVKSSAALEIAHKLGYKKARNYPGGWEEWSSKHPQPTPKV